MQVPNTNNYYSSGLVHHNSGKTTAGVVEMLWTMLGIHPYRRVNVPSKGVLVAQDFENHVKNILEPKFLQWAPPGAIIRTERNQNGAWRKVWFSSGSVLDIMSHDQDVKVFEGSDYDIAGFDEPPPKHIFNAVWRGLTDRGGICYITGTPIVGPWMYQEIQLAEKGDPLRWYTYVDTDDNATNIGEGDTKLGLKRIHEFISMLDPNERAARKNGKFLQMQGLIFKGWSAKHKIPPFQWPHHWPVIESIDPHPAKPWAVSWTGVTENGKKILLRSGYFEGVLEEVADQILFERTQIETTSQVTLKPKQTLIDNSSSVPLWNKGSGDGRQVRRTSVREELEKYIGPNAGGPRVEVAPKNVSGKITLFSQWLRFDEKTGRSDFYAFDIPENDGFFHEIENYVWDTKRGGLKNGLKDQPLKTGDDILDSIMQVALTMPKTSNDLLLTAPLKMNTGNSWKA
jgi:hypothetical protein